MGYPESLKTAMTKLQSQPLVPYSDAAKKYRDDQGIYVIWASSKLVAALKGKEFTIHAAKKLHGEVRLDLGKAFKQASIGPGRERCFYVGKTTDFQKRHAIRRYNKLEEVLGSPWTQKKIKAELQYSFVCVNDWKLRFFLECHAIAEFLPVLNTQPER